MVAIGGSAGGLEAFRGLIDGLPTVSGIAFVLVQHLDPDHPSILADLLGAGTPISVVEVSQDMLLLPDRVHVIPAGGRIAVKDGILHLSAALKNRGPRLPIDFLFASLAHEPGLRVVVIVLSGNGADGAEGVRAIRAAGGHVIAQEPTEAGYDSMPLAAIATGCVDEVLPVAAMGAAIMARHEIAASPERTSAADKATATPVPDQDWVQPVLARLKRSGHDFSGYKTGTMQRRIERRARLAGYAGDDVVSRYVARLDHDPLEVKALANDLLINVTSFFRDEDVFSALGAQTIPELVRTHSGDGPLRLWSAGCSSGEEAWSLAMLVQEELSRSKSTLKLQLFATDLDPDVIATARRGLYPGSISADISEERLKRFFTAEDDGWRIGPGLQASVVFAVHDLLTDPPFSRIDMVVCRNLLIYLQTAAQARTFSLFHFALRPGGLLLLGSAEAVPNVWPVAGRTAGSPFTLVSKDAQLYRRNPGNWPVVAAAAAAAGATPAGFPGVAQLPATRPLPSLPSARLQALETELASIRADMAATSLHPEEADVERMAIHADTLLRNQDFQAANEELITSQEELQSLNEELVALNGQLQETIDRQRTTSDDLQNILYSTDVATIFLDMDGQIRFFTPATRALFNMLPGDIGRPLADLAPFTPDPQLDLDMARVRSGAPPIEREVESSAGICYCRRVLAYRSHDQQIEGAIITYTDITDLKRSSAALQEARQVAEAANLAKSRFLAAASHDLRQPLQALVLMQELLSHKVTDPECRSLLSRVDRTLDAMAAMLDSMLDINRIEAGAVTIDAGSVVLDDLLRETVQGLALQADATGLRLRWVRSGLTIVSDGRHLATILQNLVANALKYTARGGVLVGARRRGHQVLIEVWDTGIGIPPEKFEAVFQPYHQLGPAADDRSRGLGLGLAIVRSMAELLGHHVSLRSRVGRGSVFSISVPLAPTDAAAVPASGTNAMPAVAALPSPPPTGSRILVIDDDPQLLELLELMLRDDGHNVTTARDQAEALAALLPTAPDLVISDFRLADGRDGLELARTLRTSVHQTSGRNLPVIILTGDISIDTLVRFVAHDVVRLSKPVRPTELRSAIAGLLGRQAPDAVVVPTNPATTATQNIVHVIDDDPSLLRALGLLLSAADLPIRLHASAEDFRANWHPDRAGCLLIDVRLPGESGMDLLKSLKAAGTLPPTILITGRGDIGTAVAAMRAGAIDFIEKPVSGTQIVESIRRALASGEGRNAAEAERAAALGRLTKLTVRQRQVMAMVLQGHPSKNIAADLDLSQRTVENHRAEIMRRSGCRSLPELARLVMFADPAAIGFG